MSLRFDAQMRLPGKLCVSWYFILAPVFRFLRRSNVKRVRQNIRVHEDTLLLESPFTSVLQYMYRKMWSVKSVGSNRTPHQK